MSSGTRPFEAAGIPTAIARFPNGAATRLLTIFDILRKVLSSKVDRDDGVSPLDSPPEFPEREFRVRSQAIIKSKLNRKIKKLKRQLLVEYLLTGLEDGTAMCVQRRPILAATQSEVRTNKRSRKGQQADALALEGEEGRDKLR